MHRKQKSSPLLTTTKTIKDKKYYRIKAKITDTQIIHRSGINNDYVEYQLKIITDYGRWTIKKRYEDFDKLNNTIKQFLPLIRPKFPSKRIFKTSQKTTSERISKFNKYLNYMLKQINIFTYRDIINFILIDKELLYLFLKKYEMLKIDENDQIYISIKKLYDEMSVTDNLKNTQRKRGGIIDSAINNINIFSIDNYYESILYYAKKKRANYEWEEAKDVTPNIIVIKEFLHNLSEETESKSIIFENFQAFLIKNEKIKFSPKEITELYLGRIDSFEGEDSKLEESYKSELSQSTISESASAIHTSYNMFKIKGKFLNNDEEENYDNEEEEEAKGLFYQIGNYKKDFFASTGSLDLLNWLMDTGFNTNAEVFKSMFLSRSIDEYKKLNLNTIIKSNLGGNKINANAMKLLFLIFSDKKWEKYIREIIEDDIVYKQFNNKYSMYLLDE